MTDPAIQHKHLRHNCCHIEQHSGAVTLTMTLVLMVLSTMIVIFAANYGKMLSKSIANIQRNGQAYEAAQAGLEFGINYLQQNSSTILANPVSGYIPAYSDSNITNVTLPNNSKFSITYSNPTAYNYTVIKVSSTGTSDDSSSTRTISQLVKFGSLLLNAPTRPLILKGALTLTGSSQIYNTNNNFTVQSGSTTSLFNTSLTFLSSGISSYAGNINSDITQNDSTLAGTSSADLFVKYFGLPASIINSSMLNKFNNNSNTDYSSSLNGLRGTSILINQTAGTATISGTTTIGSSSNPVVLIINGTPIFSNSTTIYGFVYIDNPSTAQLTGNVVIIGGLVATGSVSLSNSARVIYSSIVLDNLQNLNSLRYYAKIPGSWKDF